MRKFLWPVLLAVAACAAPPRPEAPPAEVPPPAAPEPPVLAVPGEPWTVEASRLEVRVYRDGPMQKLGHDHLITSDAVSGAIVVGSPATESAFDFRVPLGSLVVDDDAQRAAAGGLFAAPVPQKDRDATRDNMLGPKVLDAASHDTMRLTTESLAGGDGKFEARVRVSLAGAEHVVTAPFTVAIEGDRMKAHAQLRLTHADLGLEPFNVALGALRVRDDFDVELTLEARRGP